MGRGRKTTYKCTDSEFKDAILNYSITENGNKRSVRELLVLKEFQEATGYYKVDRLGNITPRALGSLTYLKDEKFKISERDIFNYHVENGNIPSDTKPEDWSRKNNINIPDDTVKIVNIIKYYEKDKEKFVRCLRNMAKSVGYRVEDISKYSEERKILNFAEDLKYIMYRNNIKTFSEDFIKFYG